MLKIGYTQNKIEAGCDEAGRGCLAGPVFAAAVILPKKFLHPKLNDSKLLNEKTRLMLRKIIEKEAVAWAVAQASPEEIDQINILNASFLAMHRAIEKLQVTPELLLIDGNRFNAHKSIPHVCFVKGDSRFMTIAAASILAKTYRDEFMKDAHLRYPEYGWNKNKAYPTAQHRQAIIEYGLTPLHRVSFRSGIQTKLNFDK
jgi:ribonuclease HII